MSTELTTWTPPEGGWASDGNEDVTPDHPMISLLQPMSQVDGKPGEFWFSDQEISVPSISVVILFRRETRALFEEDNNEPVCRSDDGKVPVRGMPVWETDEIDLGKAGRVMVPVFTDPLTKLRVGPSQCSMCPFSEWGEDNSPPPCGNSYVLLVDRGSGDLAQLRIKGTGIKPYRQWLAKKPANKPTYFFRTTITSEKLSKGTRTWYEPRFKAVPLEESEARRYDALLRSQMHFEPALEEPDEPSALMAEISEIMQGYLLKAAQVAKFMKLDFTEANILRYMRDNGYEEPDAFLAAVQREMETLPFSE